MNLELIYTEENGTGVLSAPDKVEVRAEWTDRLPDDSEIIQTAKILFDSYSHGYESYTVRIER